MSEETEVIVLGRKITLKSAEAVLVIYADSDMRGREALLHVKKFQGNEYFMERGDKDGRFCVAIFPHIKITGEYESAWLFLSGYYMERVMRTGDTSKLSREMTITLYPGEVNEIDVRG